MPNTVTIFPLESQRLNNLVEGQRVCPGFNGECGNDGETPEPGQELCVSCRFDQARYYELQTEREELSELQYQELRQRSGGRF